MPRLNSQNMDTHKIDGTGYGFSATRVEDLGASEYTLVVLVVDSSSSVSGFQREEDACIKEVIRACRQSPRSDNLLVRVVTFDNKIDEVHGFKPLSVCNEDDYDNTVNPYGMTALYDATVNGVESAVRYGKTLTDQDFLANGILFVLTDGEENRSKLTVKSVKDALGHAVRTEALESLVSVLVGINTGATAGLSQYLDNYRNDAGFSQYIDIGKADARSLAKLADFISRSVSSQSQALGTGGPSQSLSF